MPHETTVSLLVSEFPSTTIGAKIMGPGGRSAEGHALAFNYLFDLGQATSSVCASGLHLSTRTMTASGSHGKTYRTAKIFIETLPGSGP